MPWTLLTGEWRKLIFVNYEVEPELLKPFTPRGTQLNYFKGKCFVTLAGFMFNNIKVKGIKIPFHQQVDEINLRFYVVPSGASQQERGVVFIQEAVARPLLAYTVNFLYKEHYEIRSVRHVWNPDFDHQRMQYFWNDSQWNFLDVTASKKAIPIEPDSEEEFLTFQLRGYTKVNDEKTFRFTVSHPLWNVYPVMQSEIFVDFRKVYGDHFGFLETQKPASIFFAEGSPVRVTMRQKLK